MIGWVGRVAAWLVIFSVAVVLAVAVLVPRLAGATPYTILTGSMRPDLPPGTLVVIKPVGISDVGIGDVITYQLQSGKPTVVTHRVTAVSQSLRGETTFTTQGDANNAPDNKAVKPVQVKGKLWYSVPYLGYVNNAITGKERDTTMIVVVSGLLVYSAFMLTGSLRDRLRKPRKHVSSDAS